MIQSTIIGSCLSVAGYNNKFPRAVVFGPMTNGGMGWDSIISLNIFEKLKLLIGSIRLQDNLGKMILIQLTWIQLFSGSSVPVLQSQQLLHYLPIGWITNIHSLLVEHNIQVKVNIGWVPSVQRENDKVLMGVVHAQIPSRMWEGINRCRIFLHATTVAEITTLDGTCIPKKIRKVKSKIRENSIDFPVQTRPSGEDIEQWEYLVTFLAADGVLHTPLGKWIRPPDQHFQYLLNVEETVVYRKENREDRDWQIYRRKSRASKRFVKMRNTEQQLTELCTPVSVIGSTNYLIITNNQGTIVNNQRKTMCLYEQRQLIMEENV